MLNTYSKLSVSRAIRWKGKKRLPTGAIINLPGWEWIKAIDVNQAIDAFVEAHKPIEEYFFSGFGTRLQNIDAKMAERVIKQQMAEDRPILPVHDSFLIEHGWYYTLWPPRRSRWI
jgi:hypothetical protein